MIATNETVYQLKITLQGTTPPIWRRILVKDFPLGNLHEIIQVAMGWENCHLYDFIVKGRFYGDPSVSDDVDDAFGISLAGVATEEGIEFCYRYDFGDDWKHNVVVEKILSAENKEQHLLCLAGERACPPDDVGGVPGYAEFLLAISDPHSEDYQSLLDWIGGEFDPEKFDINAVNRKFAMVR
jgi:hypothetical protein